MPVFQSRLTRRDFLQVSGAALLGGGLSTAAPGRDRASSGVADPGGPQDVEVDDPTQLSTRRLAEAIRLRQVSSHEVVSAYLARLDTVNPWLNAVVQRTAESALERARAADRKVTRGARRGPLHGVPMTIKDSLDTAGVISAWGVPARSDFAPPDDATVVARLRAAGAILLGKTNTPELTYSFETNSPVHGATNNPYDLDRTSGGSSGGAAAIVAASGSPFDIGSDTGGSVRVPAHCCGVAGISPTTGRVPRTGNAIPPGGLLDPLTQIGPIARRVDDLGFLLSLIAGPDGRDPSIAPVPLGDPARVELAGLRGAFHTDNGIRSPTKETDLAVRTAVEALARAGVDFDERRPPGIEESLEIFLGLFKWDGGTYRRRLLERAAAPTGVELPRASAAQPISPAALTRLIERWDRLRAGLLGFISGLDLLVCPVNAYPALPHGSLADNLDAFSYTMTYSLTGWPVVVVRAGESPEGLPIGVQIIARPWREHVALAAASGVEAATGGWRPPPL